MGTTPSQIRRLNPFCRSHFGSRRAAGPVPAVRRDMLVMPCGRVCGLPAQVGRVRTKSVRHWPAWQASCLLRYKNCSVKRWAGEELDACGVRFYPPAISFLRSERLLAWRSIVDPCRPCLGEDRDFSGHGTAWA